MMLRWKPGRQGTGYRKCLLVASKWPVSFDLYLPHYPEGSGIPSHRDPVEGSEHNLMVFVEGVGSFPPEEQPGIWKWTVSGRA